MVLNELMTNYLVFIGSNTDNDVLENVNIRLAKLEELMNESI